MERRERTEEKVQELFHAPAAGDEGTDPEFMQILQNYIFGDVCYTGSLDNRMRELVTITVLAAVQALPQLKAHLGACMWAVRRWSCGRRSISAPPSSVFPGR